MVPVPQECPTSWQKDICTHYLQYNLINTLRVMRTKVKLVHKILTNTQDMCIKESLFFFLIWIVCCQQRRWGTVWWGVRGNIICKGTEAWESLLYWGENTFTVIDNKASRGTVAECLPSKLGKDYEEPCHTKLGIHPVGNGNWGKLIRKQMIGIWDWRKPSNSTRGWKMD